MPPNSPRYVSPKEIAQRRAYYRRLGYGVALALPLAVVTMALSYSDQAPLWLRRGAESLDAVFGYPVLRLIALLAG